MKNNTRQNTMILVYVSKYIKDRWYNSWSRQRLSMITAAFPLVTVNTATFPLVGMISDVIHLHLAMITARD